MTGIKTIGTNKATSGKRDNHITGKAGLFFTCLELSRRGWSVLPTPGNTKSFDVIAYRKGTKQKLVIQVRTLSKRNPVPLGTSLNKIKGDFWVVVYNIYTKEPSAFVLTPEEVKSLAHRGEKDGRVSYWMQSPRYDTPQFRDKWDRISLDRRG
jgi:hypothetical protein